MDLAPLRLNRLVITNFKSIRHVELTHLRNLTVLMGRNNAGKSNILDCFKFLSEASVSLEEAVSARGGSLKEVIHRKNENEKIEMIFEFSLAEEKRTGMVRRLFAGNTTLPAETALASSFLSTFTLKVVLGERFLLDELTVSNFSAEARACLVFQHRFDRGRLDVISGQLDALCRQASGELPVEIKDLAAYSLGSPVKLFLGKPDTAEGLPVSLELAELVHGEFATLQSIDPARNLPQRAQIQGDTVILPDASNLPDVLHWAYNNKPRQFRRIEAELAKLVPNLGHLFTPTLQNAATVAVIDHADEDLVYTMNQMSYGTKSAIAIIAKVALTDPGSWICIEEPETYLHPKAQLSLFNFLREEATAKRIFVATHSTPLAASTPIDSLFIVQRDGRDCTSVLPVTGANVGQVIDQLAVKPSFSLEADAIVFVEDADDIPVYEAWARRFPFHIKLQFLDSEGACTLHYHANLQVALSKYVHTVVYLVFDARTARGADNQQMRDRLVHQLKLPEEQIVILDMNELEGYLLDANAILRAFHAITLSEDELEAHLAPLRDQPDQKRILDDLFRRFKIGPYDGRLGARIAEATEEIPPKIVELFERLDTSSKPFWKI